MFIAQRLLNIARELLKKFAQVISFIARGLLDFSKTINYYIGTSGFLTTNLIYCTKAPGFLRSYLKYCTKIPGFCKSNLNYCTFCMSYLKYCTINLAKHWYYCTLLVGKWKFSYCHYTVTLLYRNHCIAPITQKR